MKTIAFLTVAVFAAPIPVAPNSAPIPDANPAAPIADAIPAAPIADAIPAAPIADAIPAAPIADAPPAAPIADAIPAAPIPDAKSVTYTKQTGKPVFDCIIDSMSQALCKGDPDCRPTELRVQGAAEFYATCLKETTQKPCEQKESQIKQEYQKSIKLVLGLQDTSKQAEKWTEFGKVIDQILNSQ
jgi:hypothetical protein